jgi:ADP-ribosyl-[dinitrogen reductase] hydrolase
VWAARLEHAEQHFPADFAHNGWVVEALQGAWSAIAGTRGSSDPLRLGLEAAVRGGRDADTVAAIAGGLLGAAHGASAVPGEWREVLHGWPGLGSPDLVALTEAIVAGR